MKKIYLSNILFLISSLSAMQEEKTTNQDYMHNYIAKKKYTESTDSSSEQEDEQITVDYIHWPSQENMQINTIKDLIKKINKDDLTIKKMKNNSGCQSESIFLIYNTKNELIFVLKQTGKEKEIESLKDIKNSFYFKNKNINIPFIKSAYIANNIDEKKYFILLEASKGICLIEKLEQCDIQEQYYIMLEYGKTFAEFHKETTIQYFKQKNKILKKDTLKFEDIRSVAHPDMNSGNLFVEEKNENLIFSWIDMEGANFKKLQHAPFILRSLENFLKDFNNKRELCENFLMGIKENFKDESIEASYDWFKK
jgi:hypothetical protein